MRGKKTFAVAMTAMSLAALGGGVASAGAQTQNEVLQATETTFNAGGSGWCFTGSASATFSATGPATGPYPGNFAETNANASASAPTYTSRTLTLSIPFTISSGSTTITGMVTNPPPYSGGYLLCSNFFAGGVIFNATAATYNATIKRQGLLVGRVNGTAQVSGAFDFRPARQDRLPTVTLLNFPSP